MKRVYESLLIAILVFATNSCKKIDELTHFTMSFDESLSLPAVPIIIDEPIAFNFPVSTDSEDIFDQNDTSIDLIEEIVLKEASLHVTSPDGGNFGFLKSIRFYIDIDEDRTDETLIASKINVSEDIGKDLYLDIVAQDLSTFLKREEIVLRVEVKSDEIVPEEMEIDIHTTFFIDAKILGV